MNNIRLVKIALFLALLPASQAHAGVAAFATTERARGCESTLIMQSQVARQDAVGSENWFPANPKDPQAQQQVTRHNQMRRQANIERLNLLMASELKKLTAEAAIRRIYQELVRGHIFDAGIEHMNLADQRQLRQNIIRHDESHVVFFSNMVPPAPLDVPVILKAFAQRLDQLLEGADRLERAINLASWARHLVTQMQLGLDCNTRAGQVIFNYVLARINYPHGSTYPAIDFSSDEIRYARIPISEGTQGTVTQTVELFSDDLKSYLNKRILRDLEAYAQSHGRRFLFFNNPDLDTKPDPQWAVVIDYERHLGSMVQYLNDFNLPEWRTLRDFTLGQVESANYNAFARNQVFRAELSWICQWMLSRAHDNSRGATPSVAHIGVPPTESAQTITRFAGSLSW